MFNVINVKTQAIVGTYKSKEAARKVKDRKDSAYGAYVHVVKAK